MIGQILALLQNLRLAALVHRQRKQFRADQINLVLHGHIYVSHPERFTLGHHVVLNENCYFETYGGLTIGDHVHIARCCTIYTVDHNYRSQVSIPYDEVFIAKPVNIEDCVWIGSNVSIVPGVTVSEGAIVGMGSVVTRNVPKGAVIGGNPARGIKYRDLLLYDKLKNEARFH